MKNLFSIFKGKKAAQKAAAETAAEAIDSVVRPYSSVFAFYFAHLNSP